MELLSAGLVEMPRRLTPKAVYDLYHGKLDVLKSQTFVVQALSVKKIEGQGFKAFPGHTVSVEISDGVASACLLLPRSSL